MNVYSKEEQKTPRPSLFFAPRGLFISVDVSLLLQGPYIQDRLVGMIEVADVYIYMYVQQEAFFWMATSRSLKTVLSAFFCCSKTRIKYFLCGPAKASFTKN